MLFPPRSRRRYIICRASAFAMSISFTLHSLSFHAAEITIDPYASADKLPHDLSISIEQGPREPEAVIRWEGQGELEQATRIGSSWRSVATVSPFQTHLRSSARFYRVRPSGGRPTQVYVPDSYDPDTPTPLVISLHGYTLSPARHEQLIPLKPFSDDRGFIYITPRGPAGSDGQTFWNAIPACCDFTNTERDDSGFFRSLIESIQGEFNIDPKRIHMVGHSNGGMMSYRMACEHADLIASIASLAGATFNDREDCSPSEPVSILQIHGTQDTVVAYGGGGSFVSASKDIEIWQAYNQCGSSLEDPQKTLDLDLSVTGMDSTITKSTDCPEGIDVSLWTIHGGSHSPLASVRGGQSQLAESVIDWLYAHPKPNAQTSVQGQ